MALLSINAAVAAATLTTFSDDDILKAADANAIAVMDALLSTD